MRSNRRVVIFFVIFVIVAAKPQLHRSESSASLVCQRMFGSKPTQPGQWPWLTALLEYEPRQFKGAGSLISPRFILTAAHCLQLKHEHKPVKLEDLIIYLGWFNLCSIDDPGTTANPVKFFIHPDWGPATARWEADIAIIKLEEDVPLGQNIQIIQMWRPLGPGCKDFVKEEGTVVGWGATEKNREEDHSSIPREVNLETVDMFDCMSEMDLARILPRRSFCASKPGAGPCYGDSGGGFFTKLESQFFIKGIVSTGVFKHDMTCDVHKPVVFTKVEDFIEWIDEIIAPDSRDNPLECKFETNSQQLYTCNVENFSAESNDESFSHAIGAHQDHQRSNDVGVIQFDELKSEFLPVKLSKVFPNLMWYIGIDLPLKRVERKNFKGLTDLVYLQLHSCSLKLFPKTTLYDLTELAVVNLENNEIRSIHPETFNKNPQLLRVHLCYNKISILDGSLFLRNRKLQDFTMTNNKLKVIEPEILTGLNALKKVDMAENDCINLCFPDSATKSELIDQIRNNCQVE